MAPDRDDGIEEEPFEFEEEPFDLDSDEDSRAAGRDELEEEYGDEYEEEYDEAEAEEIVRRGSREKLEAVVAGISPQTLKTILGVVVVLAVALVVLAHVHKTRKKRREQKARERAYIERAVKYTGELHRMGVEYFASGGVAPADLETRFRPTEEGDERRDVLGVAIQSRDPRSVTFDLKETAFNHSWTPLGERGRLNPKPLPGTNVHMSRGKVAIDLVEYDIRIFRQNILDDKGTVLGRVALVMFEMPKK